MIAIDLTCRRPFVSGAVAAFFVSDLTSYITGVAVGDFWEPYTAPVIGFRPSAGRFQH